MLLIDKPDTNGHSARAKRSFAGQVARSIIGAARQGNPEQGSNMKIHSLSFAFTAAFAICTAFLAAVSWQALS